MSDRPTRYLLLGCIGMVGIYFALDGHLRTKYLNKRSTLDVLKQSIEAPAKK